MSTKHAAIFAMPLRDVSDRSSLVRINTGAEQH